MSGDLLVTRRKWPSGGSTGNLLFPMWRSTLRENVLFRYVANLFFESKQQIKTADKNGNMWHHHTIAAISFQNPSIFVKMFYLVFQKWWEHVRKSSLRHKMCVCIFITFVWFFGGLTKMSKGKNLQKYIFAMRSK